MQKKPTKQPVFPGLSMQAALGIYKAVSPENAVSNRSKEDNRQKISKEARG